jgi:hypothetical protein
LDVEIDAYGDTCPTARLASTNWPTESKLAFGLVDPSSRPGTTPRRILGTVSFALAVL